MDPTWTNPGQLYLGAVFDSSYAGMRYDRQVASAIVGSLLMEGDDDYALLHGVETRRWRAQRAAGEAPSASGGRRVNDNGGL